MEKHDRFRSWIGTGIMITAAMVWGLGFFAQDRVGNAVPPFFTTFFRFVLAGLLLIPVIAVRDRLLGKGRQLFSVKKGKFHLDVTRNEWLGGVLCGFALCVAANLQQIGIADETGDTSTATFITALYVVFVPVFGLFLRRVPRAPVWVGVALAMLGFYFMTATFDGGITGVASLFAGHLSPSPGDLWILACAVVFALHILIIDHFVKTADPVRLSCIQFLTAGVISVIPVLVTGSFPTAEEVGSVIFPLLYLGIGSSAVGYTLQIVGQQYADPAVAPVILSLESVFGTLSMALLAGEIKSPVEYAGCALVFLGVVIAQLHLPKKLLFARRRKKKVPEETEPAEKQ